MFGGKKMGAKSFCSDRCYKVGLSQQTESIPEDILAPMMAQAHEQNCPKCQGHGPVDIHMSHKIWSMLILTRWYSVPQLSCKSCATKAQIGGLVFSAICGWWGFPWGLVMTPVQIFRNIGGIAGGPDPKTPSPALRDLVSANILNAHRQIQAQQAAEAAAAARGGQV